MTAPDLKTFKLKARGDHGSGKTELLMAFARMLRQLGMTAVVLERDHHLIVTSTKEQRTRLWEANRRRRAASTEEKNLMHDRNGKPLAKGDKVIIEAVITDLSATEDYCNVSLESVHGRRPDGMKETFNAINTGVLEKVDA